MSDHKPISYQLEDWHGTEDVNPGEPWTVEIEPGDDTVTVSVSRGEEKTLMWVVISNGRPEFRVALDGTDAAVIVNQPDPLTFEVSSDCAEETFTARYEE